MRRIGHQLWMQQADNVYTIGMTPELQEEAGDINYAHLAALGAIEAGDTLLNVEASKAAIEVPAPLTGKIIERNESAETDTALLNSTDETAHWLVKMTDVDPAEFASYPEVE